MTRENEAVLVTGGCGYIGSHIVHQLRGAGYPVVVVDDLCSGFRDAILDERVPVYTVDVGDETNMAEVFRAHPNIGCIIHLAAHTVVPESVQNPLKYYRNNVVNSVSLFATARRFGVRRCVFSSTAAVYGAQDHAGVSEQAQPAPCSPYGWSKVMVEQVLRDLAASSAMEHVILRYFNVAGAHPAGLLGQRTKEATHLIKVACEVAAGQRHCLTIYGRDYPTPDGTCVRDYVHVEDLARVHIRAVEYLRAGEPSVTLNCGYGQGYSVLQVVEAVRAMSGHDFPVLFGPRRPGDVPQVVAGVQRVKSILGWQADYADIKKIVAHAYAWEVQRSGRAPS